MSVGWRILMSVPAMKVGKRRDFFSKYCVLNLSIGIKGFLTVRVLSFDCILYFGCTMYELRNFNTFTTL